MEKKPFFFRINAGDLLDFATDPESNGITLLRFAKDLIKGQSDIKFIQDVIDEAHNYIEKKRKAGSAGGVAKASSAKAVLKQCYGSALAKPSTPLASNSSSNKKKKQYAEFVTMSVEDYEKLVTSHGADKTQWMIDKLNNYKGSKGKTYKDDYRAILSWVVEKLDTEYRPKQEPIADINRWI